MKTGRITGNGPPLITANDPNYAPQPYQWLPEYFTLLFVHLV
jgi:hypothetical protein